MWILIVLTLTSGGVELEGFGEYYNHGDCVIAMHEAEIAINETYEGMLCLKRPEEYYEYESYKERQSHQRID